WTDDPRVCVYTDLDARIFVDHGSDRYDLVIVDCYQRQSFLPQHLASREVFAAAPARLAPRGVVALNLPGFRADDPVVRTVANTLACAFEGEAALVWVPGTANFLVYAALNGRPALPREWTVAWQPELAPLAEMLRRDRTAFLLRCRPDERVLCDDDGVLD